MTEEHEDLLRSYFESPSPSTVVVIIADELNGKGQTVRFSATDITDVKAYQGAIASFADAHGPALAMVNNAANDRRMEWQSVTSEDWDWSGRPAWSSRHRPTWRVSTMS